MTGVFRQGLCAAHTGLVRRSMSGYVCAGISTHTHALHTLHTHTLHTHTHKHTHTQIRNKADTNTHTGLNVKLMRNIGISAHIDSGKTTLTERILYYTGRIKAIHEVRGSDGVGATMDSMELEREKGITIQSAATFCSWKHSDDNYHINVIDTPGHVDFTIEVERALRVLDGAVLVCCCVAGVQSQTLTVDRQMRRYGIPRLIFLNKLDRDGADPDRAIAAIRKKIPITVAPIQIAHGVEGRHKGVIDLIARRWIEFGGKMGADCVQHPVPQNMIDFTNQKRLELIETLAELDDDFAEKYLEHGVECFAEDIYAAIRRQTLGLNFSPVLMGSAKANTGVQTLLDAVCRYLPSPDECTNTAYEANTNKEVELSCVPNKPLVAFAFKIQDLPVGQLTYLRIYQGTLKKSDSLINMTNQKKGSVKKLVRLHSDEAKEVSIAFAGDIVAVGGIECNSGTTFTDGRVRLTADSIHVPIPVVSLSVKCTSKSDNIKFSKAVSRFQREDPTFRLHTDEESKELIMSGMGELHLHIYVERMKREYGLAVETGEPRVNFRETITTRADFEYTHKRQSGGAGQYGKIVGYMEPVTHTHADTHTHTDTHTPVEFVSALLGNDIPPNYIPSVEKGFKESAKKGLLSKSPVINTRFVLTDGGTHPVDSSDLAFRLAALGAFQTTYNDANPVVLEPIMCVEVFVPKEFQAAAIATITRRKGTITSSTPEADSIILNAEVPLKDMFGYISDIRSATQGQGEFSMEFLRYEIMNQSDQQTLMQKVKSEAKV